MGPIVAMPLLSFAQVTSLVMMLSITGPTISSIITGMVNEQPLLSTTVGLYVFAYWLKIQAPTVVNGSFQVIT